MCPRCAILSLWQLPAVKRWLEPALRIHCQQATGAGVAALLGAALLRLRSIDAAPFFVTEVALKEREMEAVWFYMVPPP